MTVWFCCVAVSPAAERLRHILADDDNVPTPTIFTEMDTLQHEGDELEWKESARYGANRVRFHAPVAGLQSKWIFLSFSQVGEVWGESGGRRGKMEQAPRLHADPPQPVWAEDLPADRQHPAGPGGLLPAPDRGWASPPLRSRSLSGCWKFSCQTLHPTLISDDIVDRQIADGLIPPELKEKISFVLLRKHRHQTKKPIHRSLADLGKSSNAASSTSLRRFPGIPKHQSAAGWWCLLLFTPVLMKSPLLWSSFLLLPPPLLLSDRSPQANLNRSTSSSAGVHRSTEDLRSWQSSSPGRLRESHPQTDTSEMPKLSWTHQDPHSYPPHVIN